MVKRSAQTSISLNVYDLSDSNAYTHCFGFGVYHSGIVIYNEEYTFGKHSGIFSHTPREINADESQGVRYRETLALGVFPGDVREIRTIIGHLRSEFGPNAYHLVYRNCNTFTDALCHELLGYGIPNYINRLAYMGSFFSCILPRNFEDMNTPDHGTLYHKQQNIRKGITHRSNTFEGEGRVLVMNSNEKKDMRNERNQREAMLSAIEKRMKEQKNGKME